MFMVVYMKNARHINKRLKKNTFLYIRAYLYRH